ncbi:Site-specific DNA recombinase [Albimonas donghaensis]|uniref:Site-specific DNA recombinase n=1 Tax=Albimonas donghaensis TaxID=356660 RepID=A0A1H3G1T2_9RHOB|nr:recombinase family protein [Albimonas donghaensis]SDX97075.1 Site-specific DNA recombinase [Albimonas donghaensis]
MLVGYARISTREQSMDGQLDSLHQAGCDKVFTEVASGAREDRPVLREALEYARPGDVLVCFKLDRVARSLPHLTNLVADLDHRQIGLRSLTEEIDTSTPGGRLVFHVFGAIAQFERDLIRERTRVGLDAARKRGRTGGRPKSMTPAKLDAARRLIQSGTPVREIADSLGVSVPTVYRHLAS